MKSESAHNGRQKLVLITGPSGAGRSTAIRALEDIGFEAIDNLPLGLLGRLFAGPPLTRPLALGLDVRNRDFSPQALLEALGDLQEITGLDPELLYLDCQPAMLLKRYSETRRRHPLASDDTPREGIQREIALLTPIKERADLLIDTTDMTPHQLRRQMEEWFQPKGTTSLSVSVRSFSYKRGLPPDADMVLDCRFLSNPHWEESLRHYTGRDEPVARFIERDARFAGFYAGLIEMLGNLLPGYVSEGRAHFSIAFGCTGGRHRSVFVAESVAETLAQQGWQVSIRHRELGVQPHGNKEPAIDGAVKDKPN